MSKALRIPKRLKVRPQWRGLPIPYIALIKPDGCPDFRVTDEQKRRSVIVHHLCQLCGEPLGRWFFFVGGIRAAKANAYFEPACHLDCLIYAMQVCPFIVGRIEHADVAKVAADNPAVTVKVDDTFATTREPWWVIKKADGWKPATTPDGTILLVPDVVKETKPMHPETMKSFEWKAIMQELMT